MPPEGAAAQPHPSIGQGLGGLEFPPIDQLKWGTNPRMEPQMPEHTIAAQLRHRLEALGKIVRYIHHIPTTPEFLIVAVEGQLTERYLVEHPDRNTFRLKVMDMWTFKHDHLHLN